ncbi:MAG TPA: CerR family C-terminal domain-containing protein [Terriglobia bacterium]|nr:CerR family C-terminal domain-containing protein [Terriglobia bacterium]
MSTRNPTVELETRERLLEAAAELFVERGYNHVTVRDICQAAGANLAAVNYYFRDKLGLYQEVLMKVIESMKQGSSLAHAGKPGASAEERFSHYVRTFMGHVLNNGRACRAGKLMAREMADPSPAFDLLIEKAIRPNSARVAALVSELTGLPPADPRVGICVGCVQTQITGFASPVAARMVPGGHFTAEIIDFVAQQVVEFSLAGMRAVAAQNNGPVRKGRQKTSKHR